MAAGKFNLNDQELTLLRALGSSFQDAKETGKIGVTEEEVKKYLSTSFSILMSEKEVLEALENLDLNKELVHWRWEGHAAHPSGDLPSAAGRSSPRSRR